jgi:8-oxo-dGTP diphosphatase
MKTAYQFCPHCGAPLTRVPAFGRERDVCQWCHFVHFNDPKVAVAGLVEGDGQVLLVCRAVDPGRGLWALPAGYMDDDELPEEALQREIGEETGLKIRVGGLVEIVPLAGWREKRGILVVYGATVAAGSLQAADDVSAARWFAPADIPWDKIAFPSTADLLRNWSNGREAAA